MVTKKFTIEIVFDKEPLDIDLVIRDIQEAIGNQSKIYDGLGDPECNAKVHYFSVKED